MLLILGLVIIVQGFRKRKEENSFSCDFDRSKAIETAEALYLGAALSVDSFGAGVSSAVSGMNSILVPILAGLMQMLFLWGGSKPPTRRITHRYLLVPMQAFYHLRGGYTLFDKSRGRPSKPPTRRIIEEPFMLVMLGWPYRVIFQKSVSVLPQGLSVASGSVPSSGGF